MQTILQRILASFSSFRCVREIPNDPFFSVNDISPEPVRPLLAKRLKPSASESIRKPPSMHDIASNM